MIPTKTINLDFWRHPTDILHLVQGEADGRKVQFKITDNGATADLTGFIAIFAIRKPDGNIVVNSATITEAESGIVETTVSSQVVTTAGNAHAELHLMKEGQLSKSFRIVTKVAPGVDIDGIAPSVSEFNALQTLIGQAETVISIADTELWPEVVANAQYFSDLAGAGRTTETVKGNADEIADVAGAGRTTETVKGNADDIAAIETELDIEQGTFTPVFEAETGVADITLYTVQGYGNYYKIGKIVNFTLRLITTSVSLGDASGKLRITGLPFLPNRLTYLSPPRLDRMNYAPPENTWVTPTLSLTGDITLEEQRGNNTYITLPITALRESTTYANFVSLTGTFTIA